MKSFSVAILSASSWPPSTWTTHVLEYNFRELRHVAKSHNSAEKAIQTNMYLQLAAISKVMISSKLN